jgi:hypothetical protein
LLIRRFSIPILRREMYYYDFKQLPLLGRGKS